MKKIVMAMTLIFTASGALAARPAGFSGQAAEVLRTLRDAGLGNALSHEAEEGHVPFWQRR